MTLIIATTQQCLRPQHLDEIGNARSCRTKVGALAAAGFDVWVVERRGTAGVTQAAGVRAGWEESLRHDLPVVQQLVADTGAGPAFWIGHSLGGVLVRPVV
ncbi:hypothetical protein IFM12275_06670 [Nocardia sputorum]|uniref:alpha/beta fold hydrolase n=1 Tax=Nocardia sputorum TaxID=2984338 RepID=UPI0024910E7E|nr:alpha/beta fold hydrolase [Nocardia sputorum]BDT90691.1 hypothetical protein IFM12275_06670 [Nocardia sputorum]